MRGHRIVNRGEQNLFQNHVNVEIIVWIAYYYFRVIEHGKVQFQRSFWVPHFL